MPELPECEANRRNVEDGALNRTIAGFELHDTDHLDLPSPRQRERLIGRQFTEARRHGKHIFAGSKSGPWIAVHLGMTGSLKTFDEPRDLPDYAHIVIAFEGERRLIFYNPRKLGWMKVIDDPDDFLAEEGVGPDAMVIDKPTFRERIGGTRGAIKSALMAQKKLAGVGNLWSDETLFQCGIAPDRRASDLSSETVDAIYDTMRDVLQGVLDANAVYGKLPDDWLIAHREEDAECRRCGGTIRKSTVGGRSAYHCDSHQHGQGKEA